ncbi:1,2-dihydroxy-3-keto-5-methylthiopentene dioxygenase [Pseudoalteromonas ulvae UL12]|uniref:Acireductone dioxygenase n=1 Tax=Pseudoalteromonas ulvae TaxID=107327 RepID=A0A244CKH8_PSEDV|nr:cupin domain-containing protein [Pseudoalteromonas ulvae]MBE0361940.1 1,2-dihydroxy-3-keto-5-methylthiopentene dioxygenase [Pseudoalteromonas ulvae UL12]OUL55877.1 acireductone dioxygenase [Pseudoalteromonas ulvae]
MSQLSIYHTSENVTPIFHSQDHQEIATQLDKVSVRFERWQAATTITDETSNEMILNAYQQDIDRLKSEGGYCTVDVISLAKGNPNAAQLREKFLFEHTHNEDEVRFFVAGQGLFCLHIDDKVYQVLCQRGDLISVPANTPHWFDMGSDPEFTAIRLFNNEAGWVAHGTQSEIASQFPQLN